MLVDQNNGEVWMGLVKNKSYGADRPVDEQLSLTAYFRKCDGYLMGVKFGI